MLILIVLLLAGGLGAYLYIQNQQAPIEELKSAPDPVVVVEPESEPEPEPEPVVEPDPEPEPVIPDPVEIGFAEVTQKRQLWPRALELTEQIELEIIYNRESFGEMTFTQGQTIQVRSLETPAYVIGKVGGQLLSIPVIQTNFASWFEQAHTTNYILSGIGYTPNTVAAASQEMTDKELFDELERWCLLNFGNCTVEIGPEKIILNWKKQSGRVNYTEEATQLAYQYLKLQAARGQGDNYAPCEIIDRNTGKSLGFGVAFRPVDIEIN